MRLKKYDEQELINIVCDLVEKDPGFRISPSTLAKASNIPVHIWKSQSYVRLQSAIKALNTSKILPAKQYVISSFAGEIERNLNNKKALLSICEQADVMINEMLRLLEEKQATIAGLINENEKLLEMTIDKDSTVQL